ncbi:hypothetical protein D5086_027771 [Populus alba]|uniref:Uncharacterized protein n=1 Tax=Populus alba TaxID=43335 RepID=A0ACC4AWA4_POPAL
MAEFVGPRLYSCCNCRNHVSLHDDIISKAFQGRHGRAFLFSHAMNIVVGPKEDRHLLTGLHTVADISCAECRENCDLPEKANGVFTLYSILLSGRTMKSWIAGDSLATCLPELGARCPPTQHFCRGGISTELYRLRLFNIKSSIFVPKGNDRCQIFDLSSTEIKYLSPL